ncbi:hypothetical protein JCM19298_1431 [Nonlabens ulvanivorans]|nr:hypothetical protein JCM19298_1431 [Nonlabens ulvanivorans]
MKALQQLTLLSILFITSISLAQENTTNSESSKSTSVFGKILNAKTTVSSAM